MDIDTLLRPISDENPTGFDARVEPGITPHYYTLKDARTSARAAERSNLFEAASTSDIPEWLTIITEAPQILCEQTKDLEICSWYTEALTRKNGFAGLRHGFELINGLISQFWDELYPKPDEDGLETRVAPLAGLNGTGAEGVLIAPIRNIPITAGNAHGPYSYWQYQQAVEIQKIHDENERQARINSAGFSLSDIQQAVTETPNEFFTTLYADIEACINNYTDISNKLDELCGPEIAPPTRNIINVLEDCKGAVKHLAGDALIIDEQSSQADENESNDATDGPVNKGAPVINQAISSREEAFKQLIKIAEYFKKTEPHSPISYILQKAVNWGNMSLEQLIQELIPDNSSREYFSSLTGVKTEDN